MAGSLHFPTVAPSAVPVPATGYYAFFVGDGTESTTSGAYYKKDHSGTVTALIPAAYSDENAQDAVGTILTDTATVDFTYDDVGNTISAIVPASAIGTTQLTNDGVTFAKMQNIATDSLIGRDTASAGDPENILLNSTLEMDGSGNLRRAALTGDVTAPTGSNATTLATVNSNVGSFGTATQVPAVTVNGKGLVTAASNTSIQIAESQVTNLTTDLAGKVPTTRAFTVSAPLAFSSGGGTLANDMALQVNPFTGDVTNGGSGNAVLTIANNAVTYAKMQDVTATNRIIGRATAGAGDPEELTPTLIDQVRHMGIAPTARRNIAVAGTALSSATTEIAHATVSLAANQLEAGMWRFQFAGQVTNGATTTVLITVRLRVGAGTGGAILGAGYGMSPITAINRPYYVDVHLHQVTSNTAMAVIILDGGFNNAPPSTTQTLVSTPVTFDVTTAQTLQLTVQQSGATGYTAGAVTPALCWYGRS